jgi:hypothetical protein
MKLQKTLIKLTIFLVIIGGFGIWLFRAMDWADKNKNEMAAIYTLRDISNVQRELKGCFSLEDLLAKGMIDSKLNDGEKAGYIFTIARTDRRCEIQAYPENENKGTRSFYSTSEDSWKIHFSAILNDKANISNPTLSMERNY